MATKEVGSIDFDKMFDEIDKLSGHREPPDNSFSVKEYSVYKKKPRNIVAKIISKLEIQGKIKRLEGKYCREGGNSSVYYTPVD